MKESLKLTELMKKVPFLTKEDIDLFEPFLIAREIRDKQLFLSEGEICQEMGFVNSGLFRMYYLSHGKEINTNFFFENNFLVDHDSFINQKPSRYFIQALEDSEIIAIDYQLLQKAYTSSKNWERFGRLTSELHIKMLAERVESFLFMEGKDRYLQLVKTHPCIFERVPLYHIASYLGMERESLSRIRRKITEERRM